VDPLSDMYPSTSPYMYVRGNPIMLIDPTGMNDDGFEVDGDGNLTWVDNTGGDDYDIIYSNNDDGTTNMSQDKALCVEKGVIQNSRQGNAYGDSKYSYDLYEINSHEEGELFSDFMSSNTNVEWGHTRFTSSDGGELSVLTTSHKEYTDYGGSDILFYLPTYDSYTFSQHDHNHFNGNWFPSGSSEPINSKGNRNYRDDIKFAHALEQCMPNSFILRIYDVDSKSYFKYNSKFFFDNRTLEGPVIKGN